VGSQHSWVAYELALPRGTHRISARSSRGAAELEATLEVTERHYAVIDYWYYPAGDPLATPRQLSFFASDEPIYFE
jgi:hypothetical protein